MSRRHIFIGDIHGCFVELTRLLEKLEVGRQDVVVALGDLVRKGPEPIRCLELWRDRNYLAVAGNQDLKLLGLRWRRYFPFGVAPRDRALLKRSDLLEYLRSLPSSLHFPEVNVLAVHGGVLPGTSVDSLGEDSTQAGVVTNLRRIRRTGTNWQPIDRGDARDGDAFWADEWRGPEIVVYGHTPRAEVRVDDFAVGLDTGCVYGGRLSAAVFSGSNYEIVSVKAVSNYVVDERRKMK